MNAARHVVLVKHALPILRAEVPARFWRLGPAGELQATRIAKQLAKFQPCALACSREPKAARTAELVGAELGIALRVVDGLEEFDRPALPLVSAAEHARLNAQIFEEPSRVVLGSESAAHALARFSAALEVALDATPASENLVVVTHGTVIALFVASRTPVDPFQLWRRLKCPAYVVLCWPSFELTEVVEQVV